MTQASYLAHRAAKRSDANPRELAMLDRDLADAGISIPQAAASHGDDSLRRIVEREMRAALRAA